jgi:hypothetical protein
MTRLVAILLIASLVLITAYAEDRPIVMQQVDLKTGRLSGGLGAAQVEEICRFVKTLRGVDRRVQEVDGTSPPEVIVHTGASRVGSGDLLRIEKRHGHWILLSRATWKLVVEQSGRKGVPPIVYEEQK